VSATEPHYGLPAAVSHVGAQPHRSNLLPLLVRFVGLAVATIWFVGRPAFATPSPEAGSCDGVVVHESGVATGVTGSRVVRVG
jgi:hypothetical protein